MDKEYIQNTNDMGEYCIITEFKPYGDETDVDWGWFWAVSKDDVDIDEHDDHLTELGSINFGPFATEEAAISTASTAWEDILGAPGEMEWLSDRSLDKWLEFQAFTMGVSIDKYREMNKKGIY